MTRSSSQLLACLSLGALACSSSTGATSSSTASAQGTSATSGATTGSTTGASATTGATATAASSTSGTTTAASSTSGTTSGSTCSPACTAGLTCLAGACIPQRCGASTPCPSGFACQGGFCTSMGCASACAPDQVCVGTACINQDPCGPNEIVCSGAAPYCANLNQDSNNCGTCGAACPTGQSCARGTCQTSCAGDETACGSLCVDAQTDNANCGACGAACPTGQVCSAGQCAAACLSPFTIACGENQARRCVSPQNDPLNCGSCGTICGAGTFCSEGLCQSLCLGVTDLDCGGICVDPQTDGQSCGGCGHACAAGQVCYGGGCTTSCGSPDTACAEADGGYCANLLSDPRNCGGCGEACAPGQVCSDGECAATCGGAAGTLCDGVCVHTNSDNQNCGGCGDACDAGACDGEGACSASGCNPGFTACGTGSATHCADFESDPSDCGKCGNACAAGQSCIAASCVTPAGNAGSCDGGCGTGLACLGGFCVSQSCNGTTFCPAGFACLDGGCTQGDCAGILCPAAQACGNGQCYPTSCGAIACDGGLCSAGTCVSVDCAGVTCPTGQTCAGGQCLSGCAGCSAPSVCVAGACQSGCSIDGASYPAGALNTANVCQGCDPLQSGTDWTPLNGGNLCDDSGDVCVSGSCVFGCSVGGQGYSLDQQNPANPCQTCLPASNALGWSAGNNGATCSVGDGNFCQNGLCAPGCMVDSSFVGPGAVDPTNSCASCQPAVSTGTYSPLSNGNACTGGLCLAGVCQVGCDVGGVAVANGVPDPSSACMVCDTALSTSAWTPVTGPVPDGGTCPSGEACQDGACAAVCGIGGQAFSPGAISDGGAYACCAPAVSTDSWSPSFTQPALYPVASTNLSASLPWVGDFDGTNGPDVLVADTSDQWVAVLLNQGNGGFNQARYYDAGFPIDHIAAGDVNGDGVLDVAVSSTQTATPSLMIATGPGIPGTAVPFTLTTTGTIEGIDIVPAFFPAAPRLAGVVTYQFGGCGGPFDVFEWDSSTSALSQVQSIPSGQTGCDGNFHYFINADLNGDGFTDLLVGFDYGFAVYLNAQSAQPLEPETGYYPGADQGAAVGPFTGRKYTNGEAMLDVALMINNNLLQLYTNDSTGTGSFTLSTSVDLSNVINGGTLGVGAADFNGDGNTDVIVYTMQAGGSVILFGDGKGNLTLGPTTGAGSSASFGDLFTADFNGDGWPDLAYFGSHNAIAINLNTCP